MTKPTFRRIPNGLALAGVVIAAALALAGCGDRGGTDAAPQPGDTAVAKVDGARAKRIFFRITVPLLSPTIGLVLIINSISAFKVFNSVVVLFSGSPGPNNNMYTMNYYIYEQINTSLEYGRAAAASLILFVIILLFTMLQRFIQRKWKYDCQEAHQCKQVPIPPTPPWASSS